MPALSERKIELLRAIVTSAPDPVLDGLESALARSGDAALSAVKRMVETETRDRRLRNVVLEPVVALCDGDSGHFPPATLAKLWAGLKIIAPEAVLAAQTALFDYRPGESSPKPFDNLVLAAAAGIRSGAPEFAGASPPAREGMSDLVSCLELSPIMRRAITNLADWLANPSEESRFSARLAYKDAAAIAPDAGPRFFEMLSPHLDPPWMMLRVISAIMDKPTERYLAESELAGFCEKILDDIDAALKTIGDLDADDGVDAAREAARLVELVTLEASEMENCIDLSREFGWGKRLVHQKKKLASVVEGRLRETEKAVAQALPMTQQTIRKLRRTVPRLSVPPETRMVKRATTLLTFVREVRFSASYGGFAVAHAKLLDSLADTLDHYVEEVLELVKSGEAENPDVAHEFLLLAADINVVLRDEKAAELVRRRAVAVRQDVAKLAS